MITLQGKNYFRISSAIDTNYNVIPFDIFGNLVTNIWIQTDTTTAPINIYLPVLTTLNGRYNIDINVVDISGTALTNPITIFASGSDIIDENLSTSVVINKNEASLLILGVSDNQWMSLESATASPVSTSVVIAGAGAGSTLRCGNGNSASGQGAVAFGCLNSANGSFTTIPGGSGNCSIFNYGTIGGGQNNVASSNYSTIAGGLNNTSSGNYSFIGGGFQNIASGYNTTIGGGLCNTASSYYSVIAGGSCATASGNYSFVGAGRRNITSGTYSAVTGGSNNTASGYYSAILAGAGNTASGQYSAVLAGLFNIASCARSYIVGSNITSDRICTTFVNNLSIKNIPTSSAGLPSGSVWANGTVLEIVP
jgi:hypothetical protein